MASEADSSLITSTVGSINTKTTNRGKKTAPIHKHTREPYAGEATHNTKGSLLMYCLRCSYAGTSTTNMRHHLKSSYGIIDIL
jgi:hypothetical protein